MAGGQANLLQDPDWRRRNSTWMVPTLVCCGTLTWISFLYIGINAKRTSWLAAAAAYGVASIVPLVLIGTAPTAAPGTKSTSDWQSSLGMACMLALWIGGSIHALVVNGQWLAFLASPQDPVPGSWFDESASTLNRQWSAFRASRQGRAPASKSASNPIRPETLDDPWRSFVAHALTEQQEIVTAVANNPSGPMRDRLQVLADHVDNGMTECWQLAQEGQRLTTARARIDTVAVIKELRHLQGLQAHPSLTQAAQALQAQLDTARRIEGEISSTYNGLLLMNARLGEVEARVIELSVRPNAIKEVAAVETVVESVVDELVAIRQALTEMDG